MSKPLYYWLNDEWCTIDVLPNPDSFTDGGFESIRYANGQMPLFKEHYIRLSNGLENDYHLSLLPPPSYLQEIIHQLVSKNEIKDAAKIRVRVFKIGLDEAWNLLIESLPLEEDVYSWPEKSWQCLLFEAEIAQLHQHYKHLERSIYLAATTKAKSVGMNDALIHTKEGEIIESCIGNIFYFLHNTWYTCPLTNGGIPGVMRSLLMELLNAQEKHLHKAALSDIEDIFICNAIRGIRPIGRIENFQWENVASRKAFLKLAEWQKSFA
jgi:4-amino-4-deoxychorismate lyase